MVKTENFSKHNPSPAECSGGETAALFYLEYKFIVKYLQAPPLLTVELSPPLLTDHSDAETNQTVRFSKHEKSQFQHRLSIQLYTISYMLCTGCFSRYPQVKSNPVDVRTH